MQGKFELKNALKIILRKHDFELKDYIVSEYGTENVRVFICKKCGKVKYTI